MNLSTVQGYSIEDSSSDCTMAASKLCSSSVLVGDSGRCALSSFSFDGGGGDLSSA